ncbi:hypothetical protein [Chloroflexus sp.]|uniref:hypothetical protein n=1 Tax=Chloroflexus sp. TaxID=1904827 RepID=UPI002ADD835E|nr:hypothetical protein [Chloroflexus sp.]
MATNTWQTQADLVKAITDIATTLPMVRVMQLYQFALFLKMHPLPEEMFSEILADEALWESQFASTDDSKLAELIAAVETEINEGKTLPMFDEYGKFLEYQ